MRNYKRFINECMGYVIFRPTFRYTFMILIFAVIASHANATSTPARITVAEDECVDDSLKRSSALSDTLPEIIVVSELIKRRGNEESFVVTKNMRKGTHNAGELLGKINGVFYNPVTTDMSYLGSQNIIVIVDSVEKDLDFIKRLNPDRFSRIDIINMPTGKYQGYDAVINLSTKKNYIGYEGVLLAQGMCYTDGRNGDGHDIKDLRGAGQFIYTHNKFSIDFYGNWSWYRQGLSDYFKTEYPLNGITETTLETSFRHPNKNIIGSNSVLSLSADYAINDNHSVSVQFRADPSWSKDRYQYVFNRKYVDYDDSFKENKNLDINDKLDLFVGVWYRGKIKKWTLNSNFTFNNINFDRIYDVDRTTGYNLEDYRHIVSRYMTGSLSAGSYSNNLKWSYSISDNLSLIDYEQRSLLSRELLSDAKYFRNTLDAAVNFFPNNKFFVGINAGVSTSITKEDNSHSSHLTPRAGLQMTWNPSNTLSARFSYTVSTAYPALSKMQEYSQFTDSLIWSGGNPNLKAAVVHDLNVVFNLYNMVTLNARYVHKDKAVFGFFDTAYGEISSGQNVPYVNSNYVNGTSDLWNVNLTFTKSFLNHWQASATAKIKGDKARFESWSSSKILPEYDWFIMYHTMKGTLQFYLSGSMRSYSFITPQQRQWQSEDNIGLSVSKYLLNNKLQIAAMYVLPLHISSGKCHGGLVSDPMITNYWGSNQSRQNNSFQLTLLYAFKGGKSVKKYNRQSDEVEL